MLTCFIGRGHAKQLFEWILIAGPCSHTTSQRLFVMTRRIFWYKWRLISIWNLKSLIPQHTYCVLSFLAWVLLDSLLFGMLSDALFAKVIYTFWIVDAYFYADPRCRRACCRLTHHAKQRAARLNLKIDTRKAANLFTRRHIPGTIVQTYSAIIESLGATSTSVFKWPMSTLSQESLHTIDSCIPP